MKRKNVKFILLGVVNIIIALFLFCMSYWFVMQGAPLWTLFLLAGPHLWLIIWLLDARTHLTFIPWEKAHPRVDFFEDRIVLHASRLANVVRGSTLFLFFFSFFLGPWVSFGYGDFMEDAGLLYVFSLFVALPSSIFCLWLSVSAQTVVIKRDGSYVMAESRLLGWHFRNVSTDPKIEFTIGAHDCFVELVVSNVDYYSKSIFGVKRKRLDKNSVALPATRNLELDEYLPQLFPEQARLLSLIFDMMCEPYVRGRTRKSDKIFKEFVREREALWKRKTRATSTTSTNTRRASAPGPRFHVKAQG